MASNNSSKSGRGASVFKLVVLILLVAAAAYVVRLNVSVNRTAAEAVSAEEAETIPETEAPQPTETPAVEETEPVPEATPEPTPEPISFHPTCTENTDPSKLISYTDVNVDGKTLDSVSDYQAEQTIQFDSGDNYSALEGVITFRGNNYRDAAAYGLANMTEFKFGESWYNTTGSLTYGDATWTGSGWTGQPLIVKWPKETKAAMNMYDWAKEDDDLVEVIYACMDGYVYFFDLTTGQKTRDSLNLGYTFKGSGALDPRGYPILYLGSGYDSSKGTSHVFIVNLLDCSVMYQFGADDSFSLRGHLSYFDSSALVDAETDTLIYPGENGILYLIHLNSQFDAEAGTCSIDPDHVVKWHYYGTRTSYAQYWVGMEDSCDVYDGYLFVTDNGGNLMCLDLNTLELVWVQDTLDDSNSTPVVSVEDGHVYLYVSTSFHLGWRSSSTATVPVWKIDAENGEIVWQTDYTCYSESGVSGGVQSTIACGKNNLSDYIYVTVARVGSVSEGVIDCLSKETGEVVWEQKGYYTWSSPVCVYNEDGTGKVIYASYGQTLYMLDGLTGEVNDKFDLYGGAEASPAVYEDWLVLGTRQCRIWGIHLT